MLTPVFSSASVEAFGPAQTLKSDWLAGYVVDYSSLPGNQVNGILGQWYVPAIQPSQTATIVTENIGIGLDTDSAPGSIQMGTSQFSNNSVVKYRAWYSRAPEDQGGPILIKDLKGKVGPGELITAAIQKSIGNNFTITMVVGSTPSTISEFSQNITHIGSQLSAYWGTYLPVRLALSALNCTDQVCTSAIANFGTVAFVYETATVNGVQHSLTAMPSSKSVLYDTAFSCNLASTGDVASDNRTFTVAYLTSSCPLGSAQLGSTTVLLELLIGGVLAVGVLLAVMMVVVLTSLRKKPSVPLTPNTPGPVVPTAPLASHAFCVNCGQPFHPNDRFCRNCAAQRHL